MMCFFYLQSANNQCFKVNYLNKQEHVVQIRKVFKL